MDHFNINSENSSLLHFRNKEEQNILFHAAFSAAFFTACTTAAALSFFMLLYHTYCRGYCP